MTTAGFERKEDFSKIDSKRLQTTTYSSRGYIGSARIPSPQASPRRGCESRDGDRRPPGHRAGAPLPLASIQSLPFSTKNGRTLRRWASQLNHVPLNRALLLTEGV